jgi:hypothetical protein
MHSLGVARRAQVIRCSVEGNSIRSRIRKTGVANDRVAKYLVEFGAACVEHRDQAMRNLHQKWIRCGGVWPLAGAKDKDVPNRWWVEFGIVSGGTLVAIGPVAGHLSKDETGLSRARTVKLTEYPIPVTAECATQLGDSVARLSPDNAVRDHLEEGGTRAHWHAIFVAPIEPPKTPAATVLKALEKTVARADLRMCLNWVATVIPA